MTVSGLMVPIVLLNIEDLQLRREDVHRFLWPGRQCPLGRSLTIAEAVELLARIAWRCLEIECGHAEYMTICSTNLVHDDHKLACDGFPNCLQIIECAPVRWPQQIQNR